MGSNSLVPKLKSDKTGNDSEEMKESLERSVGVECRWIVYLCLYNWFDSFSCKGIIYALRQKSDSFWIKAIRWKQSPRGDRDNKVFLFVDIRFRQTVFSDRCCHGEGISGTLFLCNYHESSTLHESDRVRDSRTMTWKSNHLQVEWQMKGSYFGFFSRSTYLHKGILANHVLLEVCD